MKRSEKEQIVAEVTEVAGRASGLFFTDFTGLTVEQVTELRREFRKSGVQYRVAKNTLIRKALEKAKGSKTKAASLLGVSFPSLRHRIEKLNMENGEGSREVMRDSRN